MAIPPDSIDPSDSVDKGTAKTVTTRTGHGARCAISGITLACLVGGPISALLRAITRQLLLPSLMWGIMVLWGWGPWKWIRGGAGSLNEGVAAPELELLELLEPVLVQARKEWVEGGRLLE